MVNKILKKGWLISSPFDFELKNYIFLGGLKEISEIIENNMLYSAIIQVESVLQELYDVKYNRDIIEESRKILIGIDTDSMTLEYDYPVEPDSILKMYELCDTAIKTFEEVYKDIRVRWRELERSCNISEIPKTKPTVTSGFIMYFDKDSKEIIIYKYKEPTSFSINWDTFKLTEIKRIPASTNEIVSFIKEDEELGNKNRYFRFSCNDTAKYEESIFPIMQYMLFNRIKHGI